jgi:copper chaperone NosL
MSIADPRYAAAAVTDEGGEQRVLTFDDLGCLARWESNPSSVGLRETWVHDRTTGRWLDATSATFVHVSNLETPMGSGIAAFEIRSGADAIVAERGGETLSWSAILARARDDSREAHPDVPREESR